MRNHLALSALLFLGSAACSLGEPGSLAVPEVRAGLTGALPSVIEIRMSDTCAPGMVPFSIRFSQPMERANVEAALAIVEVRGDTTGGKLPVASTSVEFEAGSFRWEDRDQSLSFKAGLKAATQYVLTLPETVTNKAGLGLDGRVGADINGDGNTDITLTAGDLARVDDDYLRTPSPFVSLPFYLCERTKKGVMLPGSDRAASVWRTPLHESRPRVLEFAGVMPSSELVPRYSPAMGFFPFSTQDGVTIVEEPLPAQGALRIRAAAPNTAPTELYARDARAAPILPSTLQGNFEVIDDGLKDYKATAFLDDQLLVPAPLVAVVDQIAAPNKLVSNALAGIPANALAGMSLVLKGANNLIYVLPILANSGTELTLEPVYYRGSHVTRDEGALQSLHFHRAPFRENELRGFGLVGVNPTTESLVAEGNTAAFVRIQSGTIGCPAIVSVCAYHILLDLTALEAKGKSFEIVPEYIFFQTQNLRRDGQRFLLRLNIGETPITDIFGNAFVDAAADGNDIANAADDVWEGVFTSGDASLAPIPPRLQLNDGRYYSPFPGGTTTGASVSFGSYGTFVHLAHGVMGSYRKVCAAGSPKPQLHQLGLLFATPDASQHTVGRDDLLNMATITNDNFGLFTISGLTFEPLPLEVGGVTVHTEIYSQGKLLERQQATLVLLTPAPVNGQAVIAGDDGHCGTGDDKVVQAIRPWQAGDRILISHRIQFPRADANTLDGNYDGILDDNAKDDMIFEYRPDSVAEPFAPIRERR